jgi:hypothetical protein
MGTSRFVSLLALVAALVAGALTLTARLSRRGAPQGATSGDRERRASAAHGPIAPPAASDARAVPAPVSFGDSGGRERPAPASPVEALVGRPFPLTWSGTVTRRVDAPESMRLALTAGVGDALAGMLAWPDDGTVADVSGRVVPDPESTAESEKWRRLGAPAGAEGVCLELTAGARRTGPADVVGFRVFARARPDGTIEGQAYAPRYEVPFADVVLSLER